MNAKEEQANVYLTYRCADGGSWHVPEQGGGGGEQQRGVPAGTFMGDTLPSR